MHSLVVSSDGTLDPRKARARKRPVVFIQGGIHSGEIDGKDAGFLYLKEALAKNPAASPFSKVTLVFVPVFNVDGHERFGRYHRPNQNGPEEMGWRTTAQNLNLNRDYMKVDAPEMRALIRYLKEWDPILYADFHVTDGAQFEHDIAVMTEPSLKGPESLRLAGAALSDRIMKGLVGFGHLPLPYYPSFLSDDDPTSGFAVGVAPPRFSQSFWAIHHRFGALVEAHSWKDYPTRVRISLHTFGVLLDEAAAHGAEWMKRAAEADTAAKKIAGSPVVLTYKNTKSSHLIDFRGYKYAREKSELSGQLRIIYDPKAPETWRVPLFDELEPGLEVSAPKKGYLVPPAHAAWVAEKLKVHGVSFETLKEGTETEVEVFRAETAEFAKEPFEGRFGLKVTGAWKRERRQIAKGSLFIPISQRLSMVVLHLFEPLAPDSFLRWGFFNAHFERKEYMEDYVAEEVGREMLKDERVRSDFEKRLKEDESFAKDPKERLDYFYRRHPSFDDRWRLYPVYRY